MGLPRHKHGCVHSGWRVLSWPNWLSAPHPCVPSPKPLRLQRDVYLPGNQVLELLNLIVGLRVFLQVPLCKEGLGETGRATQYTCSHTHVLFTPTMCTRCLPQEQALGKQTHSPAAQASLPRVDPPATQGEMSGVVKRSKWGEWAGKRDTQDGTPIPDVQQSQG